MITKFNNSSIYYTITGNGPALVLLHGFLLSPTIWTDIIPKLATKNKLIIIDLPGHGKSKYIAEIHSMELMAEVVHSILEENNIEKANFIGHSMGGYISLAFAEKYPSKIETLVLLNSSSEADSEERKINRNRAIKVIENNSEVFIKMGIAALFKDEKQEEFQHLIEKFSSEAFQFPVKGIIASIKGMRDRKDRSSILKNFKGYKYMISGVEDPIIPISSSEKTALTTNTKLYKVQSGHMSINENINEIVKIMHFIEFL
ncbi:MAG: alpha/beta hydrolase [Flavobacteriaceae bacterium]|nr:alpha/beta hydrolase [Flavobacteriaceae bacterium]